MSDELPTAAELWSRLQASPTNPENLSLANATAFSGVLIAEAIARVAEEIGFLREAVEERTRLEFADLFGDPDGRRDDANACSGCGRNLVIVTCAECGK